MPSFSAAAVAKFTVQNENGKDTYSNDKAMYGYITADRFMYVPPTIVRAMDTHWKSARSPVRDPKILGKRQAFNKAFIADASSRAYIAKKPYLVYGNNASEEFQLLKMEIANYLSLKAADLDNQTAYICAALRTRWVALGCLYTETSNDITGNNTPFGEVVIMETTAGTTMTPWQAKINAILAASTHDEVAAALGSAEDVQLYETALLDEKMGKSWVVKSAEAIWAMSEYFFRTRGHHYKPEYEELMKKMYKSGFEGGDEIPATLDFKEVFHTAIHPFGVQQLPVMAFHFGLCAKLGNSFLLRFEAAPNGLAVITTAAAALNCLRTEGWYSAFEKSMADSVGLVLALSEQILDNKYQCHMSANLYGTDRMTEVVVGGKTMKLDDAKSSAAPVATVVEGFIAYLNIQVNEKKINSFSLKNAKALQKHADNNPALSIRVTNLCQIVDNAIKDSADIAYATHAAFPDLEGMNVQGEAIQTI